MKTPQNDRRRLASVLACGVVTFAVATQAGETLNFTRRASWPGYLMGHVRVIHPATGTLVWLGLDGYAGSPGALLALDLSSLASPSVLSSIPTAGSPIGFEGGFAYAYDYDAAEQLEIYELTDPRQPVLRSRLPVPQGFNQSLMVHQARIWVVNSEGISAYDVGDPSVAKRVGGMLWDASVDGTFPNPMVVCGAFGLIRTYASQSTTLRVIDLRNPAQPTQTGSRQFSENGFTDVFSPIGDHVYYITYDVPSYVPCLHAVRINAVGEIETTGVSLSLPAWEPGCQAGIDGIWSVGDYLYLSTVAYDPNGTSADLRSLRIIDTTDRLQPLEVASARLSIPWAFRKLASNAERVFASGGISADALLVLAATNPVAPAELGIAWQSWGYQRRLYGLVEGLDEPVWRVVNDVTRRFQLSRASDTLQGNLMPYASWDLPPSDHPDAIPTVALLYSNYCYGLSQVRSHDPPYGYSAWLDVFDLSAAGEPIHWGTQQVMQQTSSPYMILDPRTVKISGDHLFLSYPSQLDIYSLSNPGSPQWLSQASTPMWIGFSQEDLEIHNGYAWLWGLDPSQRMRLMVVDVRNPANPSAGTTVRQVTAYDGAIAFKDSRLCVAYSKLNGTRTVLDVLDVTNPLHPTLVSSTLVDTHVESVGVHDLAILASYALIGDDRGLLAVDISDPSQPRTLGRYIPFPQLNSHVSSVFQVRAWQNQVVLQDDQSGIVILDLARVLSGLTYQPWWGGSLRLSWEGAPGIRLERTSSLNPALWETVPNTDGQSQATVSLTGRQGYFRLVSP